MHAQLLIPDWRVCAGDILPVTVGESKCCFFCLGHLPSLPFCLPNSYKPGRTCHVFAVCNKIATCSPTVKVPKPNCSVLLTCLWAYIFLSFLWPHWLPVPCMFRRLNFVRSVERTEKWVKRTMKYESYQCPAIFDVNSIQSIQQWKGHIAEIYVSMIPRWVL